MENKFKPWFVLSLLSLFAAIIVVGFVAYEYVQWISDPENMISAPPADCDDNEEDCSKYFEPRPYNPPSYFVYLLISGITVFIISAGVIFFSRPKKNNDTKELNEHIALIREVKRTRKKNKQGDEPDEALKPRESAKKELKKKPVAQRKSVVEKKPAPFLVQKPKVPVAPKPKPFAVKKRIAPKPVLPKQIDKKNPFRASDDSKQGIKAPLIVEKEDIKFVSLKPIVPKKQFSSSKSKVVVKPAPPVKKVAPSPKPFVPVKKFVPVNKTVAPSSSIDSLKRQVLASKKTVIPFKKPVVLSKKSVALPKPIVQPKKPIVPSSVSASALASRPLSSLRNDEIKKIKEELRKKLAKK